ncbi:MAG: trypsin-like peptidase domain-containing protein [Planctomycetes bacterium]|nr:trypsin-like peptidase domain-containing protein [Planctomycetota bacterium]
MTKPPELPPDLSASQAGVIIIRPLETGNNPYQREYDEMLYPTVRITTANGIGSGVVIQSSIVSLDPEGLGTSGQKLNSSKETREQLNNSTVELFVLTAAHVVGKYAEVSITFYDYSNTTFTTITASVVLTDTNKDLALLSLKADNYNLKTAALADRDYRYYLFAPVYVVGCSLGLNPRPSSGIISAINFDSVEITAPVLPGNSGGPVYTADTHELIGIAVWVRLCGNQLVTTMAGIVPIQTIYEFLDSATKTPSH